MAVMGHTMKSVLHRMMTLIMIDRVVVGLIPTKEMVMMGLWFVVVIKKVIKCDGATVIVLDWTWSQIVNPCLRV